MCGKRELRKRYAKEYTRFFNRGRWSLRITRRDSKWTLSPQPSRDRTLLSSTSRRNRSHNNDPAKNEKIVLKLTVRTWAPGFSVKIVYEDYSVWIFISTFYLLSWDKYRKFKYYFYQKTFIVDLMQKSLTANLTDLPPTLPNGVILPPTQTFLPPPTPPHSNFLYAFLQTTLSNNPLSDFPKTI